MTSTASAGYAEHTVKVGPGDHNFEPPALQANIGDIIHFEFFPRNHSVIRSTFEYPCISYEHMVVESKQDDQGEIYSDFMPVETVEEDWMMPWYNITLKTEEPIYMFCGAPNACTESGMVFIINPTRTKNIQAFKRKAKEAGIELLPGQPWPTGEGTSAPKPDGFVTSSVPSSTPSPSPSASQTAAAAAAAPAAHSTHVSTGAIAGIAIGGAATLAIIGILFFLLHSRRQQRREKAITLPQAVNGNQYGGGSPAFTGPPGNQQQPQTIIIPMTEAEKTMYLDRLSTQWRGNTMSPELQADNSYRTGTVNSTMTGLSRNTSDRASTGPQYHQAYGTPSSPAEM